MVFLVSFAIIEFIIDIVLTHRMFKYLSLLKIIKSKYIDVFTYVFNTSSYDEYIFESSHLDNIFILTEDEYRQLKNFFN